MKYRKHKKIWILPIAVFGLGCLILSVILYHSYDTNRKQVRTITELNAKTYAERLMGDMNRGIAITDVLEEILISENGKIDNFQKAAENQMTDFIQSIQLAPEGVVTEICPEAGSRQD